MRPDVPEMCWHCRDQLRGLRSRGTETPKWMRLHGECVQTWMQAVRGATYKAVSK